MVFKDIQFGRITVHCIHERNTIMAKNEKTSKKVGTIASKLLKNSKTSPKVKSVAGSALSQRPDKRKSTPKKKK
jgi:hypothetical protein